MIHKIKSLYDNGNGSSMRAIGVQLGISRNTVRKYLRADEALIAQQQDNPERNKRLDECRDFIIHLLQTYPKLSAVKVLRKLRQQYPALDASDRTVRRYLQALKQTVTLKQQRYYEPVLDMVPGVQCQVDPGELRGVMINGIAQTLHFVVFVLSFSRLMYVALSRDAIDTRRFIQMHDEAFRYFGGCPQECVYDQTKLVVLHELYRELDINLQFLQYATTAGFKIKACEGYDPESKGKVEAGVKYAKGNCLYGETFDSPLELERVAEWMVSSAYRTNRDLAQVGALALACTLAGRIFRSTTGSDSSSMFICVAPTAGGKDFIRRAILRVLSEAELSVLVGPASFTSEAAVRGMLAQHPTKVSVVDEFGDKLRRALRSKDGHEKAAFDSFKEVYSASGNEWIERAYAPTVRDGVQIRARVPLNILAPSMTVVGLSTPKQLTDAISDDHFEGGFLNRFISVRARSDFTVTHRRIPEEAPPGWLIERAVDIRARGTIERMGQKIDDQQFDIKPSPTTVPVETNAEDSMHEYWEYNTTTYEKNPLKSLLAARLHEHAMRLATGIAVFNEPNCPTINLETYDWCRDWVDKHFQTFARLCRDFRADSPRDADRMRMLNALKNVGPEGITLTQMSREYKSVFHRGSIPERNELLHELETMGSVMFEKRDNENGKPTITWYAKREPE